MKFTAKAGIVAALFLDFVAAAGHGGDQTQLDSDRARLELRQVPGSSETTVSHTSTSTSAQAAASGSIAHSETTVSFSVHSTNPTAVPLSMINKDEPSVSTRALDSTAAPGATPASIPNALALPNVDALNPADYPPLDRVPPVDSEEVKQWMKEVREPGIVIPTLERTHAGGCANNTAFAADADRCWWTCGGCTSSSDITECPVRMAWGLTYDDGPSPYTPDLLAYLAEHDLKSTFFVVGSRVISYPRILQAEYVAGHQVAVHTWSHASLTTLTDEEVVAELGWTRKVIKDVLGVTPNMMRPPTGDIDDRVRAISLAMGLTPVMWSRASDTTLFDTDDFNIKSGTTSVQQVLRNWGNIMSSVTARSSGFIVLAHDLYAQTVQVATGYILPDALAHQPPFTIQPVVSCLGRGIRDAYVETASGENSPAVVSGTVSSSGEVSLTGSAAAAAKTEQNTSSAASISFGVGFWLSLVFTILVSVSRNDLGF